VTGEARGPGAAPEILESPLRSRRAVLSGPAVRAQGLAWRLRGISRRAKSAVTAYNDRLTIDAVRDARQRGRSEAAAELADAIRSTAPRGHGDCTIPGCTRCAVAEQADRYARFADLIGSPESGSA
jgi:hypothetical protein